MRFFEKFVFSALCVFVAVSCTQSTEKYAQKEHGKKFGVWELNYNAGDYGVYWPSLKLAEDVQGSLFEVSTEHNWWSGAVIRRDTLRSEALLGVKITSVKSKNDAKYFNRVRLDITNKDDRFRTPGDYTFVFNPGQKDSVSFVENSGYSNSYILSREVSEKVVDLFCGNSSVNLTVSCSELNYIGRYEFVIDGYPKLRKALDLNQERKLFAQEEFDKADEKAAKELMKLLK